MGRHNSCASTGGGCGSAGNRIHLRRSRHRYFDPPHSCGGGARRRCYVAAGRLHVDVATNPQSWAPRYLFLGDFRCGLCPLGPKSATAQCAADRFARRSPQRSAGLRQRRLYFLFDFAITAAAQRLGETWHCACQDESGTATGTRWRARACRPQSHRRAGRALRRRQRRLYA